MADPRYGSDHDYEFDPRPGQQWRFYPREGRPGHVVEVLEVRRHFLHRAIVRFRYERDGKVQERTLGKFFAEPID